MNSAITINIVAKSVNMSTYLSLVTSEYLGSGAELVRELCSIGFNCSGVATGIENFLIKGYVVWRPVPSLKNMSLITTLYIPTSTRARTKSNEVDSVEDPSLSQRCDLQSHRNRLQNHRQRLKQLSNPFLYQQFCSDDHSEDDISYYANRGSISKTRWEH